MRGTPSARVQGPRVLGLGRSPRTCRRASAAVVASCTARACALAAACMAVRMAACCAAAASPRTRSSAAATAVCTAVEALSANSLSWAARSAARAAAVTSASSSSAAYCAGKEGEVLDGRAGYYYPLLLPCKKWRKCCYSREWPPCSAHGVRAMWLTACACSSASRTTIVSSRAAAALCSI